MDSSADLPLSLLLLSLSLGPFLALFYTFSVWMTYATNGEIRWTAKGKAFSVRISLLVASIAIAQGLLYQAMTTTKNNDNNNNDNTIIFDGWHNVVLAAVSLA
jgi:hypothetical protein